MNTIAISGRMVRDPEVRYTQSQLCVARFTVALDRRKGGEKVTDFIPCVAFGKQAEFVEKFFEKGKWIEISGSLQTDTYEKNGERIKTFNVVADRVGFGNDSTGGGSRRKDDDVDGFRALSEDDEINVPF